MSGERSTKHKKGRVKSRTFTEAMVLKSAVFRRGREGRKVGRRRRRDYA
jgi:hypothetical protein